MNSNLNCELKEKIFISGKLMALTGLHIGGNSVEIGIGGADQIVVRDPLTNSPYIPGSSLRGKMRSLLEKNTGFMGIKIEYIDGTKKEFDHVKQLSDVEVEKIQKKDGIQAGPSTSFESPSAQLFGVAVDVQNLRNVPIPQRLIVRDAQLSKDSEQALKNAKNADMPMTEVKTEVVIDRITSGAKPRQIERVPAGAEFEFQMILNIYGEDDPKKYVNLLFQCMELLQDDYLGGHGSRGYGRIKFSVAPEEITVKTIEDYRENQENQPAKNFPVEIPKALKPLDSARDEK